MNEIHLTMLTFRNYAGEFFWVTKGREHNYLQIQVTKNIDFMFDIFCRAEIVLVYKLRGVSE